MKSERPTRLQRLKQSFWNIVYPYYPSIEKRFVFLHNPQRQKYHIGWLAPHHTLEGLKKHLSEKWDFGNHFVAWEDKSQVLSWRKLTSFNEQYHLRVYTDGEIRGHYEYTPEAAPVRHFAEQGERAKTKDFLNFLDTYVTTRKHISHLSPDKSKQTNSPEITFQGTENSQS